MKIIAYFVVLSTFLGFLFRTASPVEAVSKVKGYYKPKTGTYVQPHYRSSSNRNKFDNWSTKGNYNPYTGKRGTKNPFNSYRWGR